MSIVTMTFNEHDFSDLIVIHDIRRDIGNETSLTLTDGPKIGAIVTDKTINPKYIEVDFSIWAEDRNTLKRKLAKYFETDSEAKLLFSDEPNVYYLARKTGKIPTREGRGYWSTGTVTFLIPDGVAHSTTYRRFDNPTVKSDRLAFRLKNDGTTDAFPIITVKHNSENGYLAAVNAMGATAIGNREEADTVSVKQSEMLLDFRDSKIGNALTSGTPNIGIMNDQNANPVFSGSIRKVNVWGRDHLELNGRGFSSLTLDIPNDSAGGVGSINDYLWWRQIFWLGATNQYGAMKITVSDTNGQFLYGVETFKRSNGLDCEYNFMATDGKGGYNMIKQWRFTGTHWDYHNPFNEPRGWSDLKRNDDRVTVYWFGTYNEFYIPEIKGKKSKKIHIAFSSIGNHPIVSHMYLDSFYYRKDHVSVAKDIPNRYPIGSTVVIDCEDDTITVDGMDRFGDRIQGSSWLKIPPGESELEIYCSSWIRNKPTVSIQFEERYL
ncbi:phage tail protein [Streptococcus suis]|nr:phage tail protein [Streptococcus suis]NQP40279.1 phage tail protein [Streptococcus suis]HEP1568297.1 phage tail family protein [Streptococcus suis]